MEDPKPPPVSVERLPDCLLFYFADGTFKLYRRFGGVIQFSREEVARLRFTPRSVD
jgi:hypothetical protein